MSLIWTESVFRSDHFDPMPELPEVEAARVLVHHHCNGKLIEQAIAADDTSESIGCMKLTFCHT